MSVDIWGVGMLALQLVLGREKFPDLDSIIFKSQPDVDAYVASIFALPSHRARISNAGKSFIHDCLTYDSTRRPTACQAFHHSWLQKPEADRKIFKLIERKNSTLWRPQRAKFPVIEDLTTESLANGRREGFGVTPGLQDIVSPHFIDQVHLQPVSPGPLSRSRGHLLGMDHGSSEHDERGSSVHRPLPSATLQHQAGASTKRRGVMSDRDLMKRPRV